LLNASTNDDTQQTPVRLFSVGVLYSYLGLGICLRAVQEYHSLSKEDFTAQCV
jgi:hypothetical protein